MSRPKGLSPHVSPASPVHPMAVHHSQLVGAVQVPPAVELPSPADYQTAQDCTGSYGKLVETWCAARGLECARVSRRFTYSLGRELDAPMQTLKDEGADPVKVIEGLRRFGVVPESIVPGDSPVVINNDVDFVALETARTWRIADGGIAAITDVGPARCAAIRQALAAQYPVGFCMYVDDGFEQWTGEATFTALTGPILGGHCVRAVGFRPGAFLIQNSWEGWGFGESRGWISDEFIGGPAAFSFYALNFAPVVTEAA